MPMTLNVPEDIARAAEERARASGITPEEVLVRALQTCFPVVPPELQAEMDAWNQASDEDMARFLAREGIE